MHDSMLCDPIQCQGHEPLKVGNSSIFKSYLFHHLQWELFSLDTQTDTRTRHIDQPGPLKWWLIIAVEPSDIGLYGVLVTHMQD